MQFPHHRAFGQAWPAGEDPEILSNCSVALSVLPPPVFRLERRLTALSHQPSQRFFLGILDETELFEMVKNADHVTLVVRDVEAAKKFFAILGFQDEIDTVISGDVLSTYMGIKNIEAQHVTLVL